MELSWRVLGKPGYEAHIDCGHNPVYAGRNGGCFDGRYSLEPADRKAEGAAMDEALFSAAETARNMAYAPYSRFNVGAALKCRSGRVFTGCNIENISFGLTICAERVAVFQAIKAGEREFEAVAIVADTDEPISPCGACRQVMAEFGTGVRVLSRSRDGRVFEAKLSELLPRAKTGILDAPASEAGGECST